MVFSPDGDSFTQCGWAVLQPTIWHVASGLSRTAQGTVHRTAIGAAAFSPDGANLATGGNEGSIILWDVKSLERLVQPHFWHTNAIASLAFSPDGRSLAAGDHDGIVCLWDLATGEQQATLDGHASPVWQICFSPDGTTLATCGDATVRGEYEVFLWPAKARNPAESR